MLALGVVLPTRLNLPDRRNGGFSKRHRNPMPLFFALTGYHDPRRAGFEAADKGGLLETMALE